MINKYGTGLLAVSCLVLLARQLPADDENGVPAGHSAHGEAFNEGPRSAAYLMKGTGDISFPVTTDKPLARKFIEQGVGQLHGFWYFEAERSFRQAAAIDPNCAIAFWGMALANRNNDKRATGFIQEAIKRRDKTNEWERMYLDSLSTYIKAGPSDEKGRRSAYLEALKKIVEKYPKDLEAKAFYGLEHWVSARHVRIKDRREVDKVLQAVLDAKPYHSVHHFRIHLWDGGRAAAQALDSAARCGQSAPSVAHMWHMPGHIYTALHRYADAAWQQEASARTDHKYLMKDRVLPDQIFNYAHNNEWLVRNLMIIGRVHDAMDLAQNMIMLPRHPKYNHFKRRSSRSSYGRRRLFEVLEYYEMWDRLIEMTNGTYLEPTDNPTEQVRRLRSRALAFMMKRKFRQAKKEMRAMLAKRPEVVRARAEAATEVSRQLNKQGASSKTIKRGIKEAERGYDRVLRMMDSVGIEMECYLLVAARRPDLAIRKVEKANTMPKERKARFYLAAGNFSKAEKLIQAAARSLPQRVQPLANMVDILYRCGKINAARQTFAELIKWSAHIDRLDTPVFKRLAPIARRFRLPKDWRAKKMTPPDVGKRPPLDSLGPFRWTSYLAPKWTLPDENSKPVSLDSFRKGKPLLVIFYLGDDCVHCVEQLNAFKPMVSRFRRLGVNLIAISTDPQEKLKKSIGPRGYPFQLVSNPTFEIFKKYRCFDDFEQQPLHGTFLLDKTGLVRWQDISYEPFTDTEFLLKETKRLLGQKFKR